MILLKLINIFLELLGIGWVILIVMVYAFGGKIKVEVLNPKTKQMDTLTDIKIEYKR